MESGSENLDCITGSAAVAEAGGEAIRKDHTTDLERLAVSHLLHLPRLITSGEGMAASKVGSPVKPATTCPAGKAEAELRRGS